MGVIGEDDEYLGSSKFDKLRRVSIIKPVATLLGLKNGDEVSFYKCGTSIVIRKRQTVDTSQDMLLRNILKELKFSIEFVDEPSGEIRRVIKLDNDIDSDLVEKLDSEHLQMLFKELFGDDENGMIRRY